MYNFKNTAPIIESVEQGFRIAKTAFFTPRSDTYTFGKERQWGYEIGLNSLPGMAKTSVWMQLAGSLRYEGKPIPAEIFDPGANGEAAFGVVPVPYNYTDSAGNDHMTVVFPPPMKYVKMFDGRPGLFIVDDFTNVRGASQDALFGLLTTKKMGDHQFNGRVRMGAAMNPTEITPGGEQIMPAVWNRFGLFNWAGPNPKEVAKYLQSGGAYKSVDLDPVEVLEEEARIAAIVDDRTYPQMVGIWSAWVKAFPEMLHSMPEVGSPDSEGPWPSHRSHEGAVRFVATAMAYELNEVEQQMCLQSAIGREAANNFFHFKQTMDLPDPTDFLDGKVHFSHDPQMVDRTYAVISGCLTAVATAKKGSVRTRRCLSFLTFLHEVSDTAGDLVLDAAQQVFQQCRGDRSITSSDEYNNMLEAVSDVINLTN